jgi:hypothetical protein
LALGLNTLLMAGSCQLSLGYTTPILGLGLFGVFLHAVLPRERSWPEAAVPAAAALLILQFMWNLNVKRPYRDAPRPMLTRSLGDLFHKLKGIKTSPANYERYHALKQIISDQVLPTGLPFVALQDYPGLPWLFDKHNPIGIDWAWPLDIHGFEPRLIDELEHSDAIAVVPKEFNAGRRVLPLADPTPCLQIDFSPYNLLSQHVARNWTLVGENDYFCLFRKAPL